MNSFFEILQVAIGNRKALSRTLSAEEWEEVYEECKKQAVAGIAFAALERLPKEQLPPGRRIRQWAVKADKIREHNARLTKESAQICRYFEQNGFEAVILKGQANYAYYPEWLQGLRSTGDIDVWCWPKADAYETQAEPAAPACWLSQSEATERTIREQSSYDNVRRVIEFCLSKRKGKYVYYHNMDFPILPETPVEVHYRPTWLYNPFANRRLQRWFGQFTVYSSQFTVKGFKVASVEFDVVFQLLHLYKHIFEEGIGLRQLLDYYFVITKYGDFVRKRNATLRNAIGDCYENDIKDNKDNQDNLSGIIAKLGLKEFAGAVMYVMQEVFAMPREIMLCEPREREGKQLLDEIMQGGNFGKYDERYNWAETMNGSMEYRGADYAVTRLRHNARFLFTYPSEVLWEPVFRIYHWFWRRFRLWRYS